MKFEGVNFYLRIILEQDSPVQNGFQIQIISCILAWYPFISVVEQCTKLVNCNKCMAWHIAVGHMVSSKRRNAK